MIALTMRDFVPLSVLTVTVLKTTPLLPARFIVTGITPFVPGVSFQGSGGSCATVQPHEVPTLLMVTSCGETFVKLNMKGAVISPGLAVYSLESASQVMMLFDN